jgi:hypothetical protein
MRSVVNTHGASLLRPQKPHVGAPCGFRKRLAAEKLPFSLAVSRRFCTIEDPIHEQRRAGRQAGRQARPGGEGRICYKQKVHHTLLEKPYQYPTAQMALLKHAPTAGHLLFPDCGVEERRKVSPTHMRRVI